MSRTPVLAPGFTYIYTWMGLKKQNYDKMNESLILMGGWADMDFDEEVRENFGVETLEEAIGVMDRNLAPLPHHRQTKLWKKFDGIKKCFKV